ncbi:MAG: hypothetical protein V2J24_15845 [Pseudomonadales bacterium]|jgi:hypothetical protein|nr:hypothetical protein [Pseudomonadales bacterium]
MAEPSTTELPPDGSAGSEEPTTQQLVARAFLRLPWGLGIPVLAILCGGLVLLAGWLAWGVAIGELIEAARANPWWWLTHWFLLLLAGMAPIWAFMITGPVLLAALRETDRQEEAQQLSDVDAWELEIRGSTDPVDYAAYSRKVLRAYYLMGQNQVSTTFYIGVGAMVFGFLFLLAGLCVQMLDRSFFPWVREDLDVTAIAIGGGLIIEFVAGIFIYIYRTTITQLNVYYRRQALVHSALLAMSVAGRTGADVDGAVQSIIETLLVPPDDPKFPDASRKPVGKRVLEDAIDKALGPAG